MGFKSYHKLQQKLANSDIKERIELYCLFVAVDSITDAFRFIWCTVKKVNVVPYSN